MVSESQCLSRSFLLYLPTTLALDALQSLYSTVHSLMEVTCLLRHSAISVCPTGIEVEVSLCYTVVYRSLLLPSDHSYLHLGTLVPWCHAHPSQPGFSSTLLRPCDGWFSFCCHIPHLFSPPMEGVAVLTLITHSSRQAEKGIRFCCLHQNLHFFSTLWQFVKILVWSGSI